MPSELPTGTVTFLFSDIENSTRLLERLGTDYARVLGEHQALLRAAWAAHGGVEIDTAGDGFFVAFPTAPAAIAAAAQATRALAEHTWPEDTALRVRIGLHTGAPVVSGARYVGLDVHRAARIAAAGHGGQILLSQTTADLTLRDLPAGAVLRDVGAHRLKDLQHPERLYQLVLPGLPAEFLPLKTLENHPNNLPVEPTPLLGRDDIVAAVSALLRREDVRLVTLTGPGGIGKTRLANHVAAELIGDFSDGVWLVRLSRLSDPTRVVPTIAQTLEVPEAAGRSIAEGVREHLAARDLLLVLDNFEQVVGAAAELAALLKTSPRLKLLVTSRVPLHVRGEREYAIPPLSLPTADGKTDADTLTQYEAVALFVQRAQAARADFTVKAANAPAIAEICRRLDGLPLAIELAAARIKLLPPETLLARLTSQLSVLTGGARDLEERQQTMRATIAWSEGLLTPAERTLLQRLAVFVGGATLEEIEAVCVAPAGAAPLSGAVLDGLAALLDHSLLRQREELGGVPRFHMLHVIREFALEQLAASGEADALSQAMFEHYLRLGDEFLRVELSTWSTMETKEWLERIEREYDNFRAALSWALEHAATARASGAAPDGTEPYLEAGLRLAGDLLWFWGNRGFLGERKEWLERFLVLEAPDFAHVGDSVVGNQEALGVRARALYGLGMVQVWQGDDEVAGPVYVRSRSLYLQAGDARGSLNPLNGLAARALIRGDLERATQLYSELLTLSEHEFGAVGAMHPLSGLAEVALLADDLDQAQTHAEEAARLGVQAHEMVVQSEGLTVQALVACRRGQLTQAAALARKALELIWTGGRFNFADYSLEVCAVVRYAQGLPEQAARLYGASDAQRRRNGKHRLSLSMHRPVVGDVLACEAKVREALGEEGWAAAFTTGQALTREEAVAEALEVSPVAAALPFVDFSKVVNPKK
jgi:predicted ATPase/class 3 adenylate cyclase